MLKRRTLWVSITLLLSIFCFASDADEICGYWRTLKGNTQIAIYKTKQNIYEGRVIWLRTEKDRPDYKNPDKNYGDEKCWD